MLMLHRGLLILLQHLTESQTTQASALLRYAVGYQGLIAPDSFLGLALQYLPAVAWIPKTRRGCYMQR